MSAPMKLTRAQRRRIEKLAERIDRVSKADRKFFQRFPLRRHRVRVASQAEIEQPRLLGEDVSLPTGKQHFVAIRYLTPDMRLRLLVVGPQDADTDLSESEARRIFELNETEAVRQVQAAMLEAAGAKK
jgi:hypothetical protein